jgi:hypothetical protein
VIEDPDADVEEETGPIRLWPALVALGLAAVLAVGAAAVVLSGGDQRSDGAPADAETVRILLVAPAGSDTLRIVTVGSGCRETTAADADLRADAIAVQVRAREGGDDGSGSCAAEVARCHQVTLPQAVGPRRLLPRPVADAELRAGAEALVTAGPCDPLALAG